MNSQAYRDGFTDGWRDARIGRVVVVQGPQAPDVRPWAFEYAKGYRAGATAYARRGEGQA